MFLSEQYCPKRASGMKVCLLVNFQRAKVEWKRILLT